MRLLLNGRSTTGTAALALTTAAALAAGAPDLRRGSRRTHSRSDGDRTCLTGSAVHLRLALRSER
jgi:hypothetical protein